MEGRVDRSVGMPLPKDEEIQPSPAQLQREVMDYSDTFVRALWAALDQAEFAQAGHDPNFEVIALEWKVRFANESMEIAAGANPRTNLLDMAVFVTAGRWALQTYWIPEVFGSSGDGLLTTFNEMESEIWVLVGQTLTPDQSDNLRSLVNTWTASSPPNYKIEGVRFRNLAGVDPSEFRDVRDARGLIAAIQRWLGNVETSLLYGERVMFYLERAPRIIQLQADLVLAQIAQDFPLTTLDPDPELLTTTLDDLSRRLQDGIESNRPIFETLLPDLNSTLGEANSLVENSTHLVDGSSVLAENVNSLVESLDRTLVRVEGLAELATAESANREETEALVADVVKSISNLESSIAGLNALLAVNSEGESRLSSAVGSTEGLIDRVFYKLLILAGTLLCGIAIVLWLASRWFRYPRAAARATHSDNPASPEEPISHASADAEHRPGTQRTKPRGD